uniref:RH1 domain-containing protein n=1 Tax=Chelydra serpentina TaxID=8475 RepID=A0A8C3T7V5_CHESE
MEEIFGGEEESASPALCEELVSGLAAGLYGELERLVGAYGRGAVAGLLPQLVSVLEALERAGEQIRERDEALELLRDDRLGLLGQYERERAGRKRAEERYMELEDAVEQERKGHRAALSRLDGQSRRLEEKARSYADQCEWQRAGGRLWGVGWGCRGVTGLGMGSGKEERVVREPRGTVPGLGGIQGAVGSTVGEPGERKKQGSPHWCLSIVRALPNSWSILVNFMVTGF